MITEEKKRETKIKKHDIRANQPWKTSRCSLKKKTPILTNDDTVLSHKSVPSGLTLPLQDEYLLVQVHYELVGPIHRGHQSGTLPFPPFEAVDLGASPAKFSLNLLAETAFAAVVLGHVDEFHTACFAGAVLVIASVSKVGPAPVSTGESLLVVKAHAYRMRQCHSVPSCDQSHLLSGPGSCFRLNQACYWLCLTSANLLDKFDRLTLDNSNQRPF